MFLVKFGDDSQCRCMWACAYCTVHVHVDACVVAACEQRTCRWRKGLRVQKPPAPREEEARETAGGGRTDESDLPSSGVRPSQQAERVSQGSCSQVSVN